VVFGLGGPNNRDNSFTSASVGPENAAGFSSHATLLSILQSIDPSLEAHSPLRPSVRQQLEARWGRENLGELISLSSESDPRQFYEALFSLVQQLQRSDRAALAMQVFGVLRQSLSTSTLSGLQERVQGSIDALEGRGAVLPRLEQFTKQFLEQAADPAMIAGMGAAGIVSQGLKAMTLGRLATTAWGTGPVSRGVAHTLAFAGESLAFTSAVRGTHFILGRENPEGFGEELRSGTLFMGALKLAQLASVGTLRLLHGGNSLTGQATRFAALVPITRRVIPQAMSLGGIMLQQRIEARLEHRQAQSWDSSLSSGLGTLLNLHFGGRVAHHILGPGFQQIQQDLELRNQSLVSESLQNPSHPALPSQVRAFGRGFLRGLLYNPLLAMAVGIGGPGRGRRRNAPVQADPLREETTSLRGVESLEVSQLSAQNLLATIETEVGRLETRYDAVKTELAIEVQDRYTREFGELRRRVDFWLQELGRLENQTARIQDHHLEDIVIGQNLLMDRVLRFGATIFSEPIQGELSEVSLRSRLPRAPKASEGDPAPSPTPTPLDPRPPRPGGIFPALVSRDVGFGQELSLRFHQAEALSQVRGWVLSQEERLRSEWAIPPEFLQGTIVMPVGGGKTRLMVAAFAETIRQGLYSVERGDKFVLVNHTDQIHRQNLEQTRRLSDYFRSKFGRDLRVTEYKADNKDLSGDLVVVSVPTVNNAERRAAFAQELRVQLGSSGRLVMTAVDEVHHVELGRERGAESWLQLLETLRQVSPNFLRLGFTGTPTGREGRVLYRVKERELMRAGVIPRTYLVRVEGDDLSKIKVGHRSEDFNERELVSTLLQMPRRNPRIYRALEQCGIQAESRGPSGKARLQGVLGFAVDLAHARQMAEDYLKYFGAENEESLPNPSLRGRTLRMLGADRGKIRPTELNEALAAYRRGEIDGIVTVVSGDTRVRDEILAAVERGEIETVFTVNALVEGSDLYMFRNMIGNRPTFSPYLKGQERGRISRRGPGEVSPEGRLLQDEPRLLLDLYDQHQSSERSLMQYGYRMGIRHLDARIGEIYDALQEATVEAIDRVGGGAARSTTEELVQERERPESLPQAPRESPFSPLIAILNELLETQYHRDLQALADDLGETQDYLQGLLEGRGWENNQWFMGRLATLLYQEREHLLERFQLSQGNRHENVTPADLAILRQAWQLYERWEGNSDGESSAHGGGEEILLTKGSLGRLRRGDVGEFGWRHLWRGFARYFRMQAEQGPLERRARAQTEYQGLREHLFNKNGWVDDSSTAQGQLLLRLRERIAHRWGGSMP